MTGYRFLVVVIVLILVCAVSYNYNQLLVIQSLGNVILWIDSLGYFGPIMLAVIHILAVGCCFPGSVLLEWIAGMMFGFLFGTIFISITKTLGGLLGFTLGRTLLREWAYKNIQSSQNLVKLYQSITTNGWKVALMLRLSPTPSWFNTYALALSPISVKHFILTTFFGALPMVMQNVYTGSFIKDLNLTDNPTNMILFKGLTTGLFILLGLYFGKNWLLNALKSKQPSSNPNLQEYFKDPLVSFTP